MPHAESRSFRFRVARASRRAWGDADGAMIAASDFQALFAESARVRDKRR